MLKNKQLAVIALTLLSLCVMMFAGCTLEGSLETLRKLAGEQKQYNGNVTATAISSSSITISWSPVPGATRYHIFRSSSTSGERLGYTTSTSYTDTGLSANTTYRYSIDAYNNIDYMLEVGYDSATTWSSGSGGGTPVTVPGANLAAKLSWLGSNAQSGGNYIVEVNANENIDMMYFSYDKTNISITLKGTGANRTISGSSSQTYYLLLVGPGVTLILDNNITLEGRSDNTYSLVTVYSNGTLIMNEGSRITGNTSSQGSGGVQNSGTFTMNGGTISGNTATTSPGGGVCNAEGGTFTMNGGTISGNTAYTGGGGVFVSTTFTKTGGTIYGYSASDTINSNVVKYSSGTIDNDKGHAVNAGNKRKETTAGPNVNLSWNYNNGSPTFSGEWDN